MREIKFRAWVTDKGWTTYYKGREQKGVMVYLGSGGDDILTFAGEGENKINIYYTENHDGDDFNVQKFILMQYTGFTDKNGKEIYEGDLVVGISYGYNGKSKQHDIPIKDKIIRKVCWGDITSYQTEQGGGFTEGYEGWVIQDINYEINYPINNCEVIGNIWENPELLKKL